MVKKCFLLKYSGIVFLGALLSSSLSAVGPTGSKLNDFRGTNQSLALIGLSTEFLESSDEERLLGDLRRMLNRYTKSYGDSSISNFKVAQNPGKQFFRPVSGTWSDTQKKFVTSTCKDNGIDLFVLGTVRQVGDEAEAELQVYDARIDTLSGIERAKFKVQGDASQKENLVYRLMNYLDRDGYVHTSAQDFLMPPVSAKMTKDMPGISSDDLSLSPMDLSGGMLAGEVQVGGEKTPFWEKWWFWALVGGGVFTTAGLTYYFTAVDTTPGRANVSFQFP